MAKKLGFLAAVAALALAIPATAGASTGLTSPKGSLVPVGTAVVGTNTTTPTSTAGSQGNLTCGSVELRGEVTANSSSGVSGNSGGQTGTATSCRRNGSQAITVDNVKLESISSSSSEPGKGKVTASFVAHFGSLSCKYQLTNAVATYTSEMDLVTLTKQPETVTPAACGPEGGSFDATFALETTAGAPIFIM